MSKIIYIISIFLIIASCTNDEKYELKSPCVSANITDSKNISTNLPCQRRSVNPPWVS